VVNRWLDQYPILGYEEVDVWLGCFFSG